MFTAEQSAYIFRQAMKGQKQVVIPSALCDSSSVSVDRHKSASNTPGVLPLGVLQPG